MARNLSGVSSQTAQSEKMSLHWEAGVLKGEKTRNEKRRKEKKYQSKEHL